MHVSDTGTSTVGKAISEHTTQRNAEVKSIINKDRQVAPKQMQLGARLAVNTHNMGRRFVESVKNALWSMRPQEAGDGLESMVSFRSRSKDTASESMRTNGKDGKLGLMKSSRQN